MTLPTEYKARKDIPLYDGTVGYFPLAFREMARVSMDGNEQHNAGEPLHWAREKSTDQINTAFRHLVDSMSGVIFDGLSRTDGKPIYHLAKTFWRIGAALQLLVEQTEAREISRAYRPRRRVFMRPPKGRTRASWGSASGPRTRKHPASARAVRSSGQAQRPS